MNRSKTPAEPGTLSALSLLCLYVSFWATFFCGGRGMALVLVGCVIHGLLFLMGKPGCSRLYLLPVVVPILGFIFYSVGLSHV